MGVIAKRRISGPPKGRKETFIRTLPLDWMQRAARLPGKACSTALAIWFLVGVERTYTIKLSIKLAKQFGRSRNAVYRDLFLLEKAHLIRTNRGTGRLPEITVLNGWVELPPATVETPEKVIPRNVLGGVRKWQVGAS